MILAGRNIYIAGNSIAAGVGATDAAHRWANLFCGAVGGVLINISVSGSLLQAPGGGCRPHFTLDMIPVKGVDDALFVFAHGVNDAGVNNGVCTPGAFETLLQGVIDNLLSKGWLPGEILICGASYFTNWISYVGICSTVAQGDYTRLVEYVDVTEEVATSNGCLYFDQLACMEAHVDPDSLLGDGLHPNNPGHALLAQGTFNLVVALGLDTNGLLLLTL